MVTRTVIASLQFMNDSDRVGLFAAVDELRRVMQHGHWTCVSADNSLSRAEEMPCRIFFSLMRSFDRKRYAAFVAAQS